ncbi:DUF2690 domain-containing protein [Streptomyces sp. NPDC058989]|uniref:helix-turn-helix domain-containing protein n=1 Tax=Streptomyces sp. NPDC058989 TaxID=3346686 RepID=UPI003687E38B
MSGRGSELREGLECARLATGMRELRARTGLSLAALAARTAYSKSSWERYLNGKKLPPRDAVEALCRLAGEPAGRLVALWELADAAWSGRAAPAEAAPGLSEGGPGAAGPADTGPGPGSGTGRARRRPWWAVPVAAGGCAGVLALVAVLVPRPAADGAGGGPAARPAPTSSAVTGCRGAACDGKDARSMYCGGQGLVATVAERTAAGGRHVEIRYAESCKAAWARLRGGRIGDRVEVSAPGAKSRSARVKDRFDAEGYLVTPMTAARGPSGVRVCLHPAGGAAVECFPR